MAFLDIKKAYDSVPRELVWEILNEMWVPSNIIKVLHKMYDGEQIMIKLGESLSQPFDTKRGLK